MNMKIQFSRIFTLTALTILLVVPVFVFTASYSHAAQNIVDGDLVTVSPNPDIYIVKIIGVKKFKRLILNPDIFDSYGHLKWSNVKTIDQATLDLYKLSELVIEINPDGSVADPKVYRVVSSENSDVGERSWLNLTASEFEAAGYDWDSLYHVNHKEALPSFYPTKTPLTYQDVIKIKQAPSLSAPVPFSIALVAPNKILAGYATNIVIKGTGFKQGAKVDFGSGTTQVVASVISQEQISVLVPAKMPAFTYNLAITNPDGQIAVLSDALTIQATPTSTAGLSTQEITSLVSPATVQIKNDKGVDCPCTGSGVIFDVAGYILTNHHVVENDDIVEVKLNDGRVISGTVLGWNAIYDLAVVKINVANIGVATLGDSTITVLGEKVVALGYPDPSGSIGFPGIMTVSDGIISSKGKTDGYGVSYLQTSALIQSGSSGGPLADSKGNIIGINTLCKKLFGLCVDDLRYAVEINQAKSILSDLKSGTKTALSTLIPTPSPSPMPTPTSQVGTLTVSKDPASPTGNVAKDYTDQELARFSFSASGEAIKITSLGVVVATSENSGINNAKLYLDGMQIGSTANLTATVTAFSFGDAFIIPAGLTKTLVIKGEVKKADGTSFSAENTIQAQLSAGVSNAQGQTSLTSMSTPNVSGNTLTVKDNDLKITAGSDTPIAQIRSMGQTSQTLATFKFTTGAGEGVNITKIVITDVISGNTSGAAGSIVNLKLFKSDGVQVGNTVASMTVDGTNALVIFNGINLSINKDASQMLTLKGDINGYSNAVSDSSHAFSILSSENIITTGTITGSNIKVVGAPAIGNPQRLYRAELTVTNAMSNMTGGASSQQQIGKYTFTNTSAGNYAITVSDLDLNISSTLGAGTGTMTIKRDSPSGATLATKTFSNAPLTNVTSWDATFTPFTIDAANGTGSVDVYILVDTASFTPMAAKTISTSFGATGVTWTDGVSTSITNIDGAPVYGATITY